jgi:predicted secreted Zn-dependent protease
MLSEGSAQTIPDISSADAFYGLPNVSIQYYDVYGTDESSIHLSLMRNSPARPDGSRALGATRYQTRYMFYHAIKGGICKITTFKVQINAIVLLPKLADQASVPERIMVRWRPFVAGLSEHEAGHIRIQYQHMHDVEAALVGSNCSEVEANFHAARDRIEVFQDAYDRETGNGATQGATLR